MAVITFGIYTFSLLRPLISLIFNIINPFIIGFIVTYVMAPIVITLQKQFKLGRVMGTLVLYMIIMLVIFLFMVILVPTLIDQLKALIDFGKVAIPNLINSVIEVTRHQFFQDIIDSLPFSFGSAQDFATTGTLTNDIALTTGTLLNDSSTTVSLVSADTQITTASLG